jgi:hypothetical protein
MTNKSFVGVLMGVITFLVLATDPSTIELHNNYLRHYEEIYLESLLLLITGALISSVVLLVSKFSFKIWFNKFFVWYFPVAYFITFLFPTSGYTMIYRYDVSIILSGVMVLVTVSMIVAHKFCNRQRGGE